MEIDVRSLSKTYFINDKPVEVLKDLSFSIKSGSSIALTGASGVGKSTLLHILGTLDSPSYGSISYNGENYVASSDSEIALFRRKNIGYVFQFHHLLSEFSAIENIAMPLLIANVPFKEAIDRALFMLEFVNLSHRKDHKPGELSGGEQQRVALARALVHNPKILLADEPTGNLDEKTGKNIIDLIFSYSVKKSATVVLVTHSVFVKNMFGTVWELTKEGLIGE